MSVIDIIILLFLIPALISGLRKGFISQIVAIISLILGAWLSYKFTALVGQWASGWIDADIRILNIIAFIVIFVAAVLCLHLLGKLLEGVIKLVMLGWLNRLLGVVFAIMKWGLVLGLLVMFFDSLNSGLGLVPQEKIDESVLYNPVKSIADAIFPYIKSLFTNSPNEIPWNA
ncbi:MAG: CvpA family protein [Candidatus Cryptobacteroides sp.]